MENERPVRTEEQKRIALEEALRRIRPTVASSDGKESVQDRLARFANRPDEPQNNATKNNNKAEKPLTLEGLAEAIKNNAQKSEELGLSIGNDPTSKSTSKEDEKKKEKEQEKENSPEKQEQKMKEMFSKIKLPSGMEIHQEGPQWVLVSKDGKQRTDVTDVMNTIDKFNRDVDAANNDNRMQNEAQSSVDRAAEVNKKDEGLISSDATSKVQMVGEALPAVKYDNGEQVFKPEDIKAVAETALSFSDEKMKLEALRDPKALEEMQERRKKNQDKEDRDNASRHGEKAERYREEAAMHRANAERYREEAARHRARADALRDR